MRFAAETEVFPSVFAGPTGTLGLTLPPSFIQS